ncbi:MAG: AMIN domain-containing protein, partial [Candidatus Aminicenantes bacterium]|nr:AMIN domain-containing protein [Candidatus Aminicenantes bacterium]
MRNKKLLILICVLLLSLANYPIRAKPTMPAYLETEEEKLLNPLPTNDQEAPPAVEVDKILAQRIEEEVLITISTTGRVEYSVLEMDNPPRIVIDLRNAINILPRQTIQVNYPQLSRIRTSQYKLTPEKVTRIVLDLNLKQSYDLFTDGNFLKVYLRALEEGAPPVVVPQAVAEEKAPPEEIAPPVKEPVAEEKAPPREEVPLEELKEEKEEEQPSEEELSLPQEQEVQVPPSFYQTRRITREEIRYTGEPISFDFNNVNIHDVIRLFADFTGLNFVIDPDVSGRITIVLHDVPWDQALDIILKNNGLGKIYELNVVRIATNQKLAQEAAAERRLKEEIELAEDPITVTWSASYAKAGNLEAIVRKNLSTKGDVIIDERTN